MIMAPRMIQAMEILQLPLLALQERIDQELIANPVLEIRGEGEEPPPPETDETDESPTAPLAEPERDLVVREDAQTEDFERLSNVVNRWENYFEEDADSFRRSRPAAGDADPKAEAMQNAPEAGATLQEYLLGLWNVEGLDKRATALGELIIRNLDDSGYLRVPLEELAAEAEPPASVEEMTEVLEEVQRTGPLGVGARDLTECLLLQLQGPPGLDGPVPDDSLDARIILSHLHNVEANRFPQIAQALKVTIDEVKEAVDRIRHLNPRPGSVISPRKTPPIVPDVRIEWDEETEQFRVTVLSGGSPELYISGAYRRLVKQEGLDPKTRQFVSRNIRSAQWLMEAIELRRDTLRRVTESIVKFQRPFFVEGPAHLQPLKMQQVGDDVHLHVSTISRAVADKFADTPWGIWPLRDFFIGGTQTTESGEDVSWDQVRARLKALVEAEDKKNPLSDEDLMKRLMADGIGKLSRRTVAKYREELGIPASRKRKEF